MNWIQVILQIVLEGLGVAKKAIPPDEIRIDRHEIRKPRLEAKQYQKILNQSRIYIRLHPKQTITTYVNFKYDMLDVDDREDLIKALKELFPEKRW